MDYVWTRQVTFCILGKSTDTMINEECVFPTTGEIFICQKGFLIVNEKGIESFLSVPHPKVFLLSTSFDIELFFEAKHFEERVWTHV